MSEVDEKINKKRNMLYYNQMVKENRKDRIERKRSISTKRKSKGFGSQKVEIRDFVAVPEGWEYFAYTFYGFVVPYLFGAAFLFFFIAGGRYDNFMLMNMNAFLVVWMIGYEIVSIILLIWILFLYLQYEDDETYY